MIITNQISDGPIKEIIQKGYSGNSKNVFLLFGDDQTCLPRLYDKYKDAIEYFEMRDDDVIVASFPKTGTTWTQEMVWLIKNRRNLENSSANIYQRFPMLEACALTVLDIGKPWIRDSLEYIRQIKGQRCIKTHLPLSLLPKDIKDQRKHAKIIYVVRNPKDAFMSYYNHTKLIDGFKGGLSEFTEIFLNDAVVFAPFWKHINGFYNLRDSPNVLLIKYEEMIRDLKSIIVRVSKFLGEDSLTDKEIMLLCERLDFKFMKQNEAVNHQCFVKSEGSVMRTGSTGTYKEDMTTEMVFKFNEWIKKNISNTELDDDYWYGS